MLSWYTGRDQTRMHFGHRLHPASWQGTVIYMSPVEVFATGIKMEPCKSTFLLGADQRTVSHHGHIIMLINVYVYYLIRKDACCHCRSVYGIPNASIPEVTLSFVIASFTSCSWYQRSCTGFQKVFRYTATGMLTSFPGRRLLSFLGYICDLWTAPLLRAVQRSLLQSAEAWDRKRGYGMPVLSEAELKGYSVFCSK